MAKFIIFENSSKGIVRIADTENKKNNFIQNQTIYTAVEVNDSDYLDAKKGAKKITLSEDAVSVSINNLTNEDYGYLPAIEGVENVKEFIKDFIDAEIKQWESIDTSNSQENINALRQIDVDSLTSVPQVSVGEWVFSQTGAPSKRPFEL